MIDFQSPIGPSPVTDLSYCFYSGGTKELFDKLEEYLTIYHSSLSKTVQEFGYDPEEIYSFNTLKTEWKKYCKFGFGGSVVIWRLKYADDRHLPDFTTYDGDEPLKPIPIVERKENEYKGIVKGLFLHLYEQGFL